MQLKTFQFSKTSHFSLVPFTLCIFPYHYICPQLTGAGVSGESGQAPVLIPVLEKWKDLGSVHRRVPSMAENIARGEMLRFNRVHVLVRTYYLT